MLVLTKTIRKMQGDRMRWFVEAICDECDGVTTIRKDWALARYRAKGKAYTCKSCASGKNLLAARDALNASGLERQFIDLCIRIYKEELDDKAADYICKKLETDALYLVTQARNFVAQFVQWIEGNQKAMDTSVIQVANYIESGTVEALELYDIEDQLKGHAFLEMETLPPN